MAKKAETVATLEELEEKRAELAARAQQLEGERAALDMTDVARAVERMAAIQSEIESIWAVLPVLDDNITMWRRRLDAERTIEDERRLAVLWEAERGAVLKVVGLAGQLKAALDDLQHARQAVQGVRGGWAKSTVPGLLVNGVRQADACWRMAGYWHDDGGSLRRPADVTVGPLFKSKRKPGALIEIHHTEFFPGGHEGFRAEIG